MQNPKIIVYAVGLYQCGIPVYNILRSYYNQSLENRSLKEKLNTRYGGKRSWALITGASEGIGRAYAIDLAKSGYNLTLVSRSQMKLDTVQH